jgi:hypothetical protein
VTLSEARRRFTTGRLGRFSAVFKRGLSKQSSRELCTRHRALPHACHKSADVTRKEGFNDLAQAGFQG